MTVRLSMLFGVWLWLAASLPVGAAQPLTVGAGRQPLAGHLEAFLDTPGKLDLDAILTTRAADFHPLHADAAYGYQRGALWLRFALEWPTPLPGERWLEIPTNLLDRVELFRLSGQGHWERQVNGRLIPFSQRALPLRKPTFRLPALVTGTEVLYLRVVTQGAIAVNPILWDPPSRSVRQGREEFWTGLGAGLLILLAVIHLSLGIALKDRTNLIYAAYAGAALAALLSYGGYFAALLTPECPQVDLWVVAIALPALLALTWPIFSAIIGFGDRSPRLDRALMWGTLVLGVVLALARLSGFNHTAGPVQTLAFPLLLLAQLLTAFWWVVQGNVPARFYLLAFLPLLVPFGYESAHNLGLP